MSVCREYQGPRNSKGYGAIRVDGRQVLLHRWVIEQIEGPLLPGEVAMHTCDNPPCFLYDHLVRGTQSDNMLDAMGKGRHRYVRHVGEHNGTAILSDGQVLRIRSLYRPGRSHHPGNQAELAERFGVSIRTILSVVHREHWKHLP